MITEEHLEFLETLSKHISRNGQPVRSMTRRANVGSRWFNSYRNAVATKNMAPFRYSIATDHWTLTWGGYNGIVVYGDEKVVINDLVMMKMQGYI